MAIVGASRNGKKFSNAAAKEFQERGYEVVYIHPDSEKIDGYPTQPNLHTVKNQVECVFVGVLAERGKMVLRDAAKAGLTKI